MVKIRDRWGLPRRWIFWRDWLFWLYACFDVYLAIQLGVIVFNGNIFQLELWAVLLITTLLLITYGASGGCSTIPTSGTCRSASPTA